jgi:hypothetical protein
MASSRKRPASGGSEPQATSATASESTGDMDGYHELLQKLRSITGHPLGFLLLKFLHPNQNVKIPSEIDFEPIRGIEKISPRQTSELKRCVSGWLENYPTPGMKAKPLAESLTTSMNKVWSNTELYASHQDCLNWIDPAIRNPHKFHSDILVHRAVDGNKIDHNQDPAVLLIDAGVGKYHPLAKVDQALCYEKILLKMGLLVEPMLTAVVTVDAERGQFQKAELVLFLVVPRGNQDFRMSLLGHYAPETLDDFVRDCVRLMQVTELMEGWKARGAPVDYECLGPHCCRIGEQVRVEQQFAIIAGDELNNVLVCRFFEATIIGCDSRNAVRTCT